MTRKNPYLHGSGFANPFRQLPTIMYGGRFNGRFDVILVLVVVALCVVSAFILPLPYASWASVTVFFGITTLTETSLPRYLFSVFPVTIAAVVLARSDSQWAGLLAISAALFAIIGVIGFSPAYTL